jgi:putative Mn2+ efflux pump MntP
VDPNREEGVAEMEKSEISRIVSLVLKAVAVGMSIASLVMGFIPGASEVNTHITLLSIGLAALAIAALQKEE